MSEPIVSPQLDGQELELTDVQNIGAVAGLADDRVFAELLRLSPYDGNVYKAVLPYGFKGALGAASPGGTVQPSGSANGSITVYPFRCVIGSRNAANAAPPGANPAANYQPTSLANWRDVRSGIFVGTSTALSASIQLASNGGNPRWDLVYATLTLDAAGPSLSRRVKSPSAGNVTVSSVPAWLSNTVTVSTVTGTAGSSPALPSVPADSAGNYNFPLAYVWVPASFSSSSTVLTKNIRSYANGQTNFVAPGAPGGFGSVEGASGCNDRQGQYAGSVSWNANGGVRPPAFVPPDCVGGKSVLAMVDALTSTTWSCPSGDILDNSIDWRNRIVLCFCNFQTSGTPESTILLGFDPVVATAHTRRIPRSAASPAGSTTVGANAPIFQMWNTCGGGTNNDDLVSGNATVCYLDDTWGMPSGWLAGLYVNASDGTLRFFASGSTQPGMFSFWLMASGPVPNF